MSLLSVEVVDDAEAHKYVHSLLDFLLYPEKLDAHLAGLREGTVHFPSGPDLIRYCLQQALAAEARGHPQLAAAAGSAQAPPVGTTEAPQGPWQSPVSPPPLPAPVARRAKLLHSWAAKMGHALELPLETIEKELPINMQQPLLMQMCQHYPNEKTHEVDFYRWVLRALMRNVGLNFITPSLPASSQSTGDAAAAAAATGKDKDAMDEEDKEARETNKKPPSGDASVPARTFLRGWINQHRDYRLEATPADSDRAKLEKHLMVVPFELGEFHFFIEDFAEAEKLFTLAKERATAFAAKYPDLDPKKWPMSRERVEGFLHACMMIGYRVHTKDSPLRAAQGLTGLLEDIKPQHTPTASTLMLHLEELRLSIASIPFLSAPEEEKRRRKEEWSWKMWDLLMRDNFSDDISWSYRLYLPRCPELAFMRGHLFILNDIKLVLRDYNLNEKTTALPFTNSLLLPLRSSSASLSSTLKAADEVGSLPPALSGIEEDLLPCGPASASDDGGADHLSPGTGAGNALHLPSRALRFLFAVSVDAIRRFSELGPLRFGTGTNTPEASSAPVTEDFLSEAKVKGRICRFLYRIAQREDTVDCWAAMRNAALRLCGLDETGKGEGVAPGVVPSMASIDTALHLARVRTQTHHEIDEFEASTGRLSVEPSLGGAAIGVMGHARGLKRERPSEAASLGPRDLFADSLGSRSLLRMAAANGGDWRPASEKRQRGESAIKEEATAGVDNDDELAALAFVLKRAKHFLGMGDLERSDALYAQVERLVDERAASGEQRDEATRWSLRHDAVYGRLVGDIRQWETAYRSRRQKDKHGGAGGEAPDDGTPTPEAVEARASAIAQRLGETLDSAGPPQRIETLTVVLGFLANSQQWEQTRGELANAGGTQQQQPLGGSPLHHYCQRVEALCLALQQQQRGGSSGANAAAASVTPPILATAWSVPPRYVETVRVAVLLADLCTLATRHLRTLVEQQDANKENTNKVAPPRTPPLAPTDAMQVETVKEEGDAAAATTTTTAAAMEEGEAREEDLSTGTQIIRVFDGLLEFLVVPQSPAVSNSSQPCIEWAAGRGLLAQLWEETCLESVVGLFAGSLYFIQRQTAVPSVLAVECYGHLAQLASTDGFFERSGRVSPQTVASLWEVFRATLQRLHATQPQSERWLFGLGDAAYEVGQFRDAVRYYLLGGGVNNSFFCDPTAPISVGFQRIIPRLVTSLISTQAYLEAAVLCQFYPTPDYATAFKAVQSNPAALHEPYFQYLWEIPILELLVNIFTKIGHSKRAAFLIDLIGQKELNEYNGAAQRSGFIRHMKQNFLKSLCRQVLTSPVPSSLPSGV